MTENDFLAGIVEHPDELDRWLILADWLEDRDDPRCELARLRYLLHTEPDHPEQQARLLRRQALHDRGLLPVVPTLTNALGMTFALILPGTFVMGSPVSEQHRFSDENQKPTRITKSFYLGVYPVTVGEFSKFFHTSDYEPRFYPSFDQAKSMPMTFVTWQAAQALVAWLNESDKDDLVYTLPTEAQWEYACRAGTQTAYFWGDDASRLDEYTWVGKASRHRTRHAIKSKPNPWGLYYMLGQACEWCADWYDVKLLGGDDPVGPRLGANRVFRGGGEVSEQSRVAYRGCADPKDLSAASNRRFGIRLVASLRGTK